MTITYKKINDGNAIRSFFNSLVILKEKEIFNALRARITTNSFGYLYGCFKIPILIFIECGIRRKEFVKFRRFHQFISEKVTFLKA